MSDVVFPSLPGQTWPFAKTPALNTKVQRAVSGKEYRAAFALSPLYTFILPFSVLREFSGFTEWQELCGLFLARLGAYDSFLFTDPSDYTVTAQEVGTGDGAEDEFQLVRSYGAGGFTSDCDVQNINAVVGVYDNGTPLVEGPGAGEYQLSDTGLVTLGTPLAADHVLTWSGTYYHRCRFLEDEADFVEFMSNFWSLSELRFIGSPESKV